MAEGMKAYFQEMLRYERWANGKVLAFLDDHPDNGRLLKIFGHLIAEMVPWLCLLQGKEVPRDLDCSPSWTVMECRRHAASEQAELGDFVAALPEDGFLGSVSSPGPSGRVFENTVAEILTHLLSHAQHHRGQIEMIIQDETGQYFPTSYLPYLRQQPFEKSGNHAPDH